MAFAKAAEFFAGIGLVRLALERSDWDVVFANDISLSKRAMYSANFGDTDFVLADIGLLPASDVPNVDLATASFPCIDLSLAGNRRGLTGEHSSTFWDFHRILKEKKGNRPRFVLLENVVGLLSSKGGMDLREIIFALGKLGYACDVLLVDAVHFVPQSRPRLFVVGCSDQTTTPVRHLQPHSARPEALIDFILRNDDLRWHFAEVPELPGKKRNLARYAESFPEAAPDWWKHDRQEHLWQQMSPNHQALLSRLRSFEQPQFATVYKRVRPGGCRAEIRADGIAGCLRTPRGGSSKQFVIEAKGGNWKVRNMTALEYARLQGAPDYKITVPYTQALFGFGDAVCVPAVEWVVRNTINTSAM